MALNYVHASTFQLARNGTTSFSIPFTAAASGNLLIAIAVGGVTLTTPTGWTLVNSSIDRDGFYIWKKTASAAESSAATTGNASNYPIGGTVYEFVAGSTVDSSVTSGNTVQLNTAANPTETPASGKIGLSVVSYTRGVAADLWTDVTWSTGTKDFSLTTAYATTDGYLVSGAWTDGAGAAFAPTTTQNNTGSEASLRQSMSTIVTVVAPTVFMARKLYTKQQAVNRSYTY